MTRSCKSETWQHSFLSIKVSLGLSRVWQRMRPHRPLVADPLESWQLLCHCGKDCPFSQCIAFMPRGYYFLR